MDKSYIIQKKINYDEIWKEEINEDKDNNNPDEEETYIPHHNILDYTLLYKKYKEKNNIKYYNKLPVNAYRYPLKYKDGCFDTLKRELINDQIDKDEYNYSNGDFTKQKQGKFMNNYEGNLRISLQKNPFDETVTSDNTQDDNVNELDRNKKKSLREKIYDGEVMFYDDYIEQLAAKDYERFFRKPYEVKNIDEGGKYYFYGKKLIMDKNEDIYRKYNNYNDEYFIKKLQLYETKKKKDKKNLENKIKEKQKQNQEKILELECQKLDYTDRKFIQEIKDENKSKNLNIYKFYKNNKNIFEKKIPDIIKKELLYGYIPDIILPANVRKTKHPQNCTVPLSSLYAYAQYIDDMFKCPYIYTAIDAELTKYWKTSENEIINSIKSEKIKKSYKQDIYAVSKEQLEKYSKFNKPYDNNKHTNIQDIISSFNFKLQKKERKTETVCNGRYVI
ncbi:apical exonemal protein, putative [Plasmodium vinckei]|uniref:Apical exonemal protein, putative n=1 Tax=Plasmodium vinckei TaxID=5860 RepID=A0A6V7SYN0_PLAVN|nr:apical exonemal protein, putative [Plasmodium vinckei]